MNKYLVEGGHRLSGEIVVQGAKNSALPILAASILPNTESEIHNCPRLSDVAAAIKILNYLGCDAEMVQNKVRVRSDSIKKNDIPDNLMREMRSSIVFLGAVLTKCSKARLSFPGGCELGPRPIDLHLNGLRQLGAVIEEDHGFINCSIPGGRLKGASISLSFPSVGATENIMIAAALADGETVITNCAREPEIVDLANYLNACGADIKGAGESVIVINGVEKLTGTRHSVISDRIVGATYLCAAAITKGEVLLKDIDPRSLSSILPILESAGCHIKNDENSIYLKCDKRLDGLKTIRTMPYPGFPTDAQSPIMSLACVSDGMTMFVENIFENRYKHVCELSRLGADIKVEGRVAVVQGVRKLSSSSVHCTDLRGGAALIVASLCAEGVSEIRQIHHIERGYEDIAHSLCGIGAKISRQND